MICKKCKKPIEKGKEGWFACKPYHQDCCDLIKNPSKRKEGKHMKELWKKWEKQSNE